MVPGWVRRGWLFALALVLTAAPAAGAGAAPLHWSAPAQTGHGGFTSVSCASSTLCVGATSNGLVTSTDPASGAGSWQPVIPRGAPGPCIPPPTLPPGTPPPCVQPLPVSEPLATFSAQAVSCPSPTLCVAAGLDGQTRRNAVLVSTDPTGGPTAWSETQFADTGGLGTVSCSSSGLCLALGYRGGVRATANPAGGAGAWTSLDLYPYHPSGGASCVPGLCALESYERAAGSYVLTSSTPTMGIGAWSGNPVEPGTNLGVLACASKHLCVAADAFGIIYASRAPASGTWRVDPSTYPRGNPFARGFSGYPTSASCSPGGLCAIGEGGSVLTSSNPFGSHRWRRTRIDGVPFAISCPTNQLCVAADREGRVLTGSG